MYRWIDSQTADDERVLAFIAVLVTGLLLFGRLMYGPGPGGLS